LKNAKCHRFAVTGHVLFETRLLRVLASCFIYLDCSFFDMEVDSSNSVHEHSIEDLPALDDDDASMADRAGDEEAVVEGSGVNKGKNISKAPATLSRDPGKSLFPMARVQRILKADKELPTVAREAVLLISLATEEFVKRLSEDIASVVRRADEFLFLEEIISWPDPSDAPARRKPGQKKDAQRQDTGPSLLDKYITNSALREDEEDNDAADSEGEVVMNEDGTIQMA